MYQHKEPINFTVISDTRLTMARDGHEEAVARKSEANTKAMSIPCVYMNLSRNQFKALVSRADVSRNGGVRFELEQR